jgi:hypothetical protein
MSGRFWDVEYEASSIEAASAEEAAQKAMAKLQAHLAEGRVTFVVTNPDEFDGDEFWEVPVAPDGEVLP